MLLLPPFDPLEWLVGLVILVALLVILKQRKHSGWYIFCFAVFWVYLLVLLNATVFPLPEYRAISASDWQFWAGFTLSHVNLVPFNYGEFSYFGYVFPEVVSNILMTVPFGFGLNFIAHFKARDFLWIGLALGLAIESAQLAVSLIWTVFYHVVDINDVILNALGVLLGYAFYRVFSWTAAKITQRLATRNAKS